MKQRRSENEKFSGDKRADSESSFSESTRYARNGGGFLETKV